MSLKKGTINIGTIIKGDTTKKIEENDVNFYDYRGNLVYSYSAEEFLELSDFPPLPTYPGMRYIEWNWSFEEAYDYVYHNGALDIGGLCTTDDDKIRIMLDITNEHRLSMYMKAYLYRKNSSTNTVSMSIDWGDGSSPILIEGTTTASYPFTTELHTYPNIGKYTIELTFDENTMLYFDTGVNDFSQLLFDDIDSLLPLNNDKFILSYIKEMQLSVNHFKTYTSYFRGMSNLEYINLPNSANITGGNPVNINNYGSKIFERCFNLKCVVIPNSVGCIQSFIDTANGVYPMILFIFPSICIKYQTNASLPGSCLQNLRMKRIFLPIKYGTNYAGQSKLNTAAISSTSYAEKLYIPYGYTSSNFVISGVREIYFPSTITQLSQGSSSQTNNIYHFEKCISVPILMYSIYSYNGFIYVPGSLYYEWIAATNWSALKKRVIPIGEIIEPELSNISINTQTYNIYKTHNFNITVTYNDGNYCPEDEKGFVLTVNSGPAIVDGNTLVVNNTAQDGDEISITVTSTYNNAISDTKTITLSYVEESYTINLNEGQWVLTEDVGPNNEQIYESDAGSYHIDNGKSTCFITVNGYTSFKVMIYSDAESSYDYTEAFAVDTTTPSRNSGLYTTKSKQKQWIECSYTLDGGEHTIPIMYSKDGSGNSGEDRGRFYIVEE